MECYEGRRRDIGDPAHRYYKLQWKGLAEETWVLSRYMKCAGLIKEYFAETELNTSSELIGSIDTKNENRWRWCNQAHKRAQDLKGHYTRRCPSMPGKRAGSRTERAVLRNKQKEVRKDAGEIYLEGPLLENVFNFKYVGFTASADCVFRHAVAVRLAQEKARFGQLWKIWGSNITKSA